MGDVRWNGTPVLANIRQTGVQAGLVLGWLRRSLRMPAAPRAAIAGETQWALDDGPTVLVGAGWSGTAVSALGSDHRVTALVYRAAAARGCSDSMPRG